MPPAPSAFEDSTTGLKSLVEQLGAGDARAAAIAESLRLPDPKGFFTVTFQAPVVDSLLAEYTAFTGHFAGLPEDVAIQKAGGRTELLVERFDRRGDPSATGLQDEAFKAMKAPVPLYSVRMHPPGKASGYHLFNFVYVDGGFRFVGKLKKAQPDPTGPMAAEVAAVMELRNKDREVFFETGKLPD
jgi:hypothetical protein